MIVLESIEDGYRLPKPSAMPDVVYRTVVQPCWIFNSEGSKDGTGDSKSNSVFKGRASFAQLDDCLKVILRADSADASTNHVATTTVPVVAATAIDDAPPSGEYLFRASLNGSTGTDMYAFKSGAEIATADDDPRREINNAVECSVRTASFGRGSNFDDGATPIDPTTPVAVGMGLYARTSFDGRSLPTTTTPPMLCKACGKHAVVTFSDSVDYIPTKPKSIASTTGLNSVTGTSMSAQIDNADEVLRATVNTVDTIREIISEPSTTIEGPML